MAEEVTFLKVCVLLVQKVFDKLISLLSFLLHLCMIMSIVTPVKHILFRSLCCGLCFEATLLSIVYAGSSALPLYRQATTQRAQVALCPSVPLIIFPLFQRTSTCTSAVFIATSNSPFRSELAVYFALRLRSDWLLIECDEGLKISTACHCYRFNINTITYQDRFHQMSTFHLMCYVNI